MDRMAEGLRQQGWAVWNIECRGVDEPGGGYPGTDLDAGTAPMPCGNGLANGTSISRG